MMKLRIKYKMRSPVSHIGETASTGSYFQTVLTANGRLPVITGNSIRGQIRDSMAMHMLDLLGVKVSKDTFNILFSGGNINGAMKDDVEKAKNVREKLPLVSLLGGGLGDMIMSGKLLVSFAYPVCIESWDITGIPSEVSWHSLIDEIEFTRTDDGKNDIKSEYMENVSEEKTAKASTQMRFEVQYMATGTEFVQDFIFLDGTTDLELGAFYAGIRKWFETPRIGGMAAKGFGFFDAEITNKDTMVMTVKNGNITVDDAVTDLISRYEAHILAQGSTALTALDAKEKKKNGKANKSD